MLYLGDFPADQAVYFMWNTNDGDGASITRSTDGVVSVYKDNSDGSSFDQTQVTTGVTGDEDVDSLTGVHSCCITTTDAWYEAGHDYTVVLVGALIDTQTVNVALAHFSIENRYMRGTDSAALASVCTEARLAELAAANLPADIDGIKAKTDNLPADPASETNVNVNETKIDALPTVAEIKTAIEADGSMLEHLHEMTEDDGGVRRLTENALEEAPSGTGGDATAANQATIMGYIDTEVAAIKAKTDNLPADPASETNVNANEAKIDNLPAAVKTAIEADGSKLDHVWETTEDDGGVRRFSENALEQAPSGTGGDATAANQATIISYTALAKKILANKAVQNKSTGVIIYYDDDGSTPILTITPTDDGSLTTRTPS